MSGAIVFLGIAVMLAARDIAKGLAAIAAALSPPAGAKP